MVEKILISLIESFEIFDGDFLFIVAAAPLYVLYQMGNRSSEVNHQFGIFHHLKHVFNSSI